MKCPSCGASIVDDALVCAYCNQPTPAAHEQRRADAEAERQREAEEDAFDRAQDAKRLDNARKSIRSSGLWAVIWGVLGLFTCIFPVFSIVAIFMGLKARRLAREFDVVVPTSVTAGSVVGGVGIAFGVFFWIIGGMGIHEVSQRKDALQVIIDAGDSKEQLDAETACALAEYSLLTDGWTGKRGTSIDDFACTGRVEQDGDFAQIDDVVFHTSNDDKWDLRACFKRGTKWSLKGFRQEKGCDEDEAPPPPKKKKKK
ncbi:MAG: DUF4190 domain-containing protein [Deltaproteobacteria bacterium]